MTEAAAALVVFLFLTVVSHPLFHCDVLMLLILALVHLRAALLCAGRSVRRAWQFFRANYSFAVDDVRREADAQL